MKNRVRKNGNTSTPAQQTQSNHNAKFDPECDVPQPGRPFDPSYDHPACLCLVDRSDNAVTAKIPLSEDEMFLALMMSRGENGLAQFIADAVRRALSPLVETAVQIGKAAAGCQNLHVELGVGPGRNGRPAAADVAIASLQIESLNEQIVAWAKLGDTLPDPDARSRAKAISRSLSEACAQQLEIKDALS